MASINLLSLFGLIQEEGSFRFWSSANPIANSHGESPLKLVCGRFVLYSILQSSIVGAAWA